MHWNQQPLQQQQQQQQQRQRRQFALQAEKSEDLDEMREPSHVRKSWRRGGSDTTLKFPVQKYFMHGLELNCFTSVKLSNASPKHHKLQSA